MTEQQLLCDISDNVSPEVLAVGSDDFDVALHEHDPDMTCPGRHVIVEFDD